MLSIDPDLHIVIVGSVSNDDYFRELVDAVSQAKIQNRVTIIPGLAADSADIVNAYHSADFFLLPSLHEPFGIVILEAWAAGTTRDGEPGRRNTVFCGRRNQCLAVRSNVRRKPD